LLELGPTQIAYRAVGAVFLTLNIIALFVG
jgi:hypothetical protein